MILCKLHGWGNDFLVALDADQPGSLSADADWSAVAVALCDRRRGIGADGLIHGAAPAGGGADVVMALFNADGSRAEMSGNGIRCLAHAVVVSGGTWRDSVVIDTDVGRRQLTLSAPGSGTTGDIPTTVEVRAPMGLVAPHPGPPPDAAIAAVVPGSRFGAVDVGNPHLVVLVDDPDGIDLAVAGPAAEAVFADGVNVEFIAPDGAGGLVLRVWERGAGITEACGTGACAAAAVAHQWELVGPECNVRMPGGTASVALNATGATLTGPSSFVGTIEVPSA